MVKITWKVGDTVVISAKSSSTGKGKRQKVTEINEKFTIFKGGYRCEHKFIIPIQDHQKKPAKVVLPVDPPVATRVPQKQKRDQLVNLVNEVIHLRNEISDIQAQMTEMQEMFMRQLRLISDVLEIN